ncbi:MAG: CinA family nicotinamide mononucleotide deamidase-related protein [Desulfobacula sp.]|nr:CinA family nicotinamide mononucleotide deamidase-related protein [Desulfobacula sp.]
MITAHIMSTGDEVLLGDIVDTNAAFLCAGLKQMGIGVQKLVAVGDKFDDIVGTLIDISKKADICIVTGGLGPTSDDLTAMACTKAVKETLELNPAAMDSMEKYFKKRRFELTKENKKQAMLPKSATILINDNGTAPGFFIQIDQCLFFFLPGVPFEMKLMFENKVKPVLKERFTLEKQILIERLTVFGLAESRVSALLAGFKDFFPEFKLGFRADFPLIEVKLICKTGGTKQIKSQMTKAKNWAVEHLENKVISKSGLSLARQVGSLLIEQKKTLAIAESCTGGLIANMMTDVSGSSDYFLFSGGTYSNDAKMNVLGVKKETIIEHGAVHEQTAQEMAMGARKMARADFAISTTGIAGPTGGTKKRPVGMVCIGVAGDGFSGAKTYRFAGDDRLMNKQMFAAMALELLRRQLVSESIS